MADALLSCKKIVIAPLEGTLLRGHSFFPFYMLVALEAGSPLRAFLLLVASPVIFLVSFCISRSCSIKLLVFISTAGLRLSDLRAVSTAVLAKFFLDNLEPAAYKAFLKASSGTHGCMRCVLSSHPKVLVEYCLRTHLHVDIVLASELQITDKGICTGFFWPTRSMVEDDAKSRVVDGLLCGDYGAPPILWCICVKGEHHGYLSQCQEKIVVQRSKEGEKVPSHAFPTPLVFHDGRLVALPTVLTSLAVALWIPMGFVLCIARVLAAVSLPQEIGFPLIALLGLRFRLRGAPPVLQLDNFAQKGVVYACVHRTLADPTFVSMALRRKIRGLAFSVSKISEFLTPIHCTNLTRNRDEDAKIIKRLLEKEDLCICPEGTTCREPFLLRFSPLFADLADWIVPVAAEVETTIFHGTSARGYKFLDGFFLAMNPTISYTITILDPVCTLELRNSGKSAIEIANSLQELLAKVLGYRVTNYTRRDKYSLLAGHDGKSH